MSTDPVIKVPVHLNINKTDDMRPDLQFAAELDGQPLRGALWTRRTRDGAKMYHSMSITRPYNRLKGRSPDDTLVKNVKLYELRKPGPGFPDYQSPEPCDLLGHSLFAALWTELGPDDDGEITFRLELLKEPYQAAPTQTAAAILADIKARAIEIRQERKLAEQAAAANAEQDDLPGLPVADDLPF